jgi:hypothetical protein
LLGGQIQVWAAHRDIRAVFGTPIADPLAFGRQMIAVETVNINQLHHATAVFQTCRIMPDFCQGVYRSPDVIVEKHFTVTR